MTDYAGTIPEDISEFLGDFESYQVEEIGDETFIYAMSSETEEN